ncbi:MAG: hypothetical protein JSR79_05660 [Proteobacteria bacterium]|nr:hypothetical protein [Pseudomonadota bacterium]
MIHDAHASRGEFIDLCAQIECWAVATINRALPLASGRADKMPHLLGQKLKLIGDLAADDAVFAKPARIRELLGEIAPLMKMRSDLAHARLLHASEGGEEIYAFELPAAAIGPVGAGRFWLKREETPALICALKQARKELADQKLKS